MTARPYDYRTIGIHPTSSGFGWMVCEGPFNLVESGLFHPVRKSSRLASIRELERLLARFRPAELVLEALTPGSDRRLKRAHRREIDLVAVAADRSLYVEAYARDAVLAAFSSAGARTRHEIAEQVVHRFPGLAHRLPKKRKTWEGSDRRLAIFNAAAAVITHFENGANTFLDEMRKVA